MVLMLFVVLTGCDTFADAQARIAQAQELIAAQNHQGALIKLRNALKSEPQNLQARVLLVEVLLHLGDASGAEKELRRAMQNGAPVAEIADLLARVRLETGQADILVTQLASGELPLAEPARSLYRGQAFLQLQDNKAAAESFRAVLASDPDSVAARIGLAQAAAAQGDADTALAELNRAVQKDEGAQAWLVRGVLQAQRGEFEAAERDLRAAREHAQGKLPAAKQMQLLAALIETRLARNDLTGAREIGEELDSRASGVHRLGRSGLQRCGGGSAEARG